VVPRSTVGDLCSKKRRCCTAGSPGRGEEGAIGGEAEDTERAGSAGDGGGVRSSTAGENSREADRGIGDIHAGEGSSRGNAAPFGIGRAEVANSREASNGARGEAPLPMCCAHRSNHLRRSAQGRRGSDGDRVGDGAGIGWGSRQ
jgi:hypothetical protein